MPHFLLQLENPVHQRLARRRTPRHINIHRHNPIAPPRDTITIMIIPAPIRATAHRHHPPRVRHLIVDLAQGWGHFVGKGAGNDHDVGLAGGGAEDYAKAVLIVAGGGKVHHFDGAASEAEGHGPEGALAGPVGDLVEGCSGARLVEDFTLMDEISRMYVQCVLHGTLFFLLAWKGHFTSDLARDTEWRAFNIAGFLYFGGRSGGRG